MKKAHQDTRRQRVRKPYKEPKEPREKNIILRVNEDEYKTIQDNAKAAGMGISEFLRTTGQGMIPTANRKDHQDLTELIKVAAGLASLGNLLKMALNRDEGWREQSKINTISEIYDKITTTREQLTEKIKAL